MVSFPRKCKSPSPSALNLRPHQEELLQLSELAGIHADPTILKIIIELLNMQVSPHSIYAMLKTIRRSLSRRSKMLAPIKSKPSKSSS